MRIQEIHDKVLNVYLEHRKKHPKFTFSTRVSNRNNRLDEGYWFQGNEHYLFSSPFKKGDSLNKTKSMGFVLVIKNGEIVKCYIEIVFSSKNNRKMENFYREVLRLLNIQDDSSNYKFQEILPGNYIENLKFFLDDTVPRIEQLIHKYHLEDKFIYSQEEFDKNFSKIQQIKSKEHLGFKKTRKKRNIIKPFNKIYYGPPGTGKTYNTVDAALQILDLNYYNENQDNRSALKSKFDEYVKEERIGFVTFHQSFSYEDFVEGLKAEADDDGNIQYYVQDGIFKQLCEKASKTHNGKGIDEAIQQLTEKLEEGDFHLKTSTGKGFTVSYRGGRTFRIKPDSSGNLTDYAASIENIKKIYRGANIKDVYNSSYVLSLLEYLKSEYGLSDEPVTGAAKEPVVLIIDEINRGNTANIFGELITLIEPSKRHGAGEALSVVLPYSKERFSVPDNLFIIGTMNTADRSLALIDTALRRRFQFEEMHPEPELLTGITIEGVDIQQLLTVMNKRIALLYDREHSLGHSFFMSLNENSTIHDLRDVFEGQILPLLEEYFFEDWEKIRQVMGDPLKPKDLQIIKPDVDEEDVALLLGDSNNNMINNLYYRDHTALSNPQVYIAIYERS